MHDSSQYDVVIAGAGPVGLFLACELRLSNLSVLILEKEKDPFSPLKCLPFGMRGLSTPTIEAFYRRGLLEHIKAPEPNKDLNAATAHWTKQQRKSGGHFAGIQFYLDQVNTEFWQYQLDGSNVTNMQTDMSRIESILAIQADKLGVEIRRGDELKGFDQLNDLVIVQTHHDTIKTKWLVGCDGGRSVVRKIGNFEFVGTEPEFTGYSAQIKLEDSNLLVSGRHYTPTGMYTYQQPGILAMVDFDGGRFHRTQPITLEHVQSVLRYVSGTQVKITELTLVTTWTDRAFQAASYRNGRVLLAGDAAHIHSPLGGQGLNLGIGDAMNLGWKLAATIRGDAPENLLDSYQLERHPIGAQILNWSRAQVAVMRPSPSSRAIAEIFRDLIETKDGATYFADRIWGMSLCYNIDGDHPLVGRSVPNFGLSAGKRLGEHLSDGYGVLLDFDADEKMRDLAHFWNDRILYLECNNNSFELSAVLVRPDGFVAWVGLENGNYAEAKQACKRWFGSQLYE